MNQLEYRRSIANGAGLPDPMLCAGRVHRVIASARKTSQRDAESRTARTCRCTSLSGLARARERRGSQHLCCCQSASLRQLGNAPKKASPRCGIYIWILTLMARPGSLHSGTRIAVPTPTAIISTSPGKYQVLWRVEGFDFEKQERTLESYSPSLSEAIPLAPTATVFSVCLAS